MYLNTKVFHYFDISDEVKSGATFYRCYPIEQKMALLCGHSKICHFSISGQKCQTEDSTIFQKYQADKKSQILSKISAQTKNVNAKVTKQQPAAVKGVNHKSCSSDQRFIVLVLKNTVNV